MSKQLKRDLQDRHIYMISLSSCIGTGLFMAIGKSISEAGVVGAILVYFFMAIIVYFLIANLAEMIAYKNINGIFCEYIINYVDPALGFSTAWSYWFNWIITISTEIIAASLVIKFWLPYSSILLWSIFFFILIFILNIFSVKIYGEVEFWLSLIKILMIIIFIIISLLLIFHILDSNKNFIFKNWHTQYIPIYNGWLRFISVFMIAGFSFQGSELIGVAISETKHPNSSILKIVKQIFWRLLIFYILTIVSISSLLLYSNNPLLANIIMNKNITISPFTMIFKSFGFNFIAHIINLIILIAIISAANTSMYSATRILWHLATIKQAPGYFANTNSKGTPIIALLLTSCIGLLFFLISFIRINYIFIWFINISSLSGFIAWLTIIISHYRFRKAYIKQNKNLKDLPYIAKFFPYSSIFTLIAIIIIIFSQSITILTLKNETWFDIILELLSTYMGFFIFIILYFSYKFIKKTKLIKLEDCNLTR